jgi:Zn-dependent protease with chaperone function
MFYLLCVTLCFAVLFIVTAVAGVILFPLLRVVVARSNQRRPRTTANLIFLVRIVPFLLGLIAAIGLVLPAFLEFEPSATGETPGVLLLLFAGLGTFILSVMLVRCTRILLRTYEVQKEWLRDAQGFSSYRGLPVYRVDKAGSLLAVTGVFRPRIFISRDVAGVLNGPEFDAALAHELSHVKAGDNLKQLVLKITRLAGWLNFAGALDAAWVKTSEMAADEGAITRGATALDLSSALVKVGRLSMKGPAGAELAASHLVDGCVSATQARAARLRELLEYGSTSNSQSGTLGSYTPVLFAALFVLYLILLSSLPSIHELLEFLVR